MKDKRGKKRLRGMTLPAAPWASLVATVCNLLLAYAVYMLCRVVYVWENWSLFAMGWDALSKGELLRGGLLFDSSAIAYTNVLYAILMLLPLAVKERRWWHTAAKWLFVTVNSLAVVANLVDAVYSQFTGRRTTSTFFREFSNEGNIGDIVLTELAGHWYLLVAGIALITLLWILYVRPGTPAPADRQRTWCRRYYLVQTLALLLAVPLSVAAMRGGFTKAVRPITLSNANRYVNQPSEAAIVLNTPFTVIRTIGKTTFQDPGYFAETELEAVYTPLHASATVASPLKGRNVVILIVESFGREYIGFYNRHLDGGSYKGYTPFIDSLLEHSLTFEQTYANGRKSIDAMPSILSSIPMFVEPFFVTNYSLNSVSGIAGELGKVGYSSAFFHGAENGSMGFQAFARTTGFERYYGRTEYDADPRFGGEKDFDGTWAIWDEPFLQFYATTMSDLPEPFVTAVFTASSHHPFAIPDQYRERFPEEGLPMHKCIRYTDMALQRFFETASRQPWYSNTVFVITSDHTNMSDHDEYRSSIGVFRAPIIFFDPSGQLPTGVMPGVAQQIDIMPTLLSLLGYDRPYVAFGKDLLATALDSMWTVNYSNGIYQYLCRDTLVQFDGERVVASYCIADDPLLQHPLAEAPASYVRHLKGIIQQYMVRMVNNKLVP